MRTGTSRRTFSQISGLRRASFSLHVALLLILASAPHAYGRERSATVQTAYRMPGAYTLQLTTPVSSPIAIGVIGEVKPGDEGVQDEYSDLGWKMAGAQVDYYFGDKAQSFVDTWLISSWIAYGQGGSEEGHQHFGLACSTVSYQWIWASGFNIQTGIGLQWQFWARPDVPSKFGDIFPNGTVAAGWAF